MFHGPAWTNWSHIKMDRGDNQIILHAVADG